jgi:hypothetical protein
MATDREYLDALATLMRAYLDAHPLGRSRPGQIVFTLEGTGQSSRLKTVDDDEGPVLLALEGDRDGLKSLFTGKLDAELAQGSVRVARADADFLTVLSAAA